MVQAAAAKLPTEKDIAPKGDVGLMADISSDCREVLQRRGAGYPDSKHSSGMRWPCSNGRARAAD